MAPIHLLVLIHGMWGSPIHLAELARTAQETYAEPSSSGVQLKVLLAETNSEDSTYDGIDWGGERVAKEVAEKVKELEEVGDEVTRFSVTGYSLGGLVARYLVGILYQRGFFEKITPVNFNTIATPHIGLPRYSSFMSSVFSSLGPRLLSRTGEQFYCADKWSPSGRPLLLVMADPDRIFHQALATFEHIRIYANSINDSTVPYVTAAIETYDPFAEYEINGIKLEFHDKYAPIIRAYELPDVPPPIPSKPVVLSAEWFRKMKSSRPFLPPFLQFRFPFNILLYSSLPILIPVFISMALLRFTLASRSSRARIKVLEQDESNQDRLIHILAEIEKEMEDAMVDFIDDPDPSPETKGKPPAKQPILTVHQRKIIGWLNMLPIKKELAFFPGVRNSHAMIVCRDIKRFEAHRLGEGVVRHWADSLIL